ncbi:MAG: CBS domain-containing protein [Candidatus Cloacimonetes bacterium]|jgi:acetoin utilization protein AcuB|nr:CBS domain-containing protein [Candidatus Cloacimonadota bacterium]
MLVRSRMAQRLITVAPDTPIADALALSRKHRIRHLPVVQGERLVGLVTDRDIRLAIPPMWADEHEELQAALRTRTVQEVMTRELITAHPDMPIEEAGKLLYKHKIGSLPVVTGDALVGILTESDVLRAFVDLFGVNQPSSRIEVRMENRPGELARVVRVIGIEHRVNITGLVLAPTKEEYSIAIMHLQTVNPTGIIDALRRLGYTIGWPSLEIEAYGPIDSSDGHSPTRGVVSSWPE